MTPRDDLANVVAHAVLQWPMCARLELAQWLAARGEHGLAHCARTWSSSDASPSVKPPRYYA